MSKNTYRHYRSNDHTRYAPLLFDCQDAKALVNCEKRSFASRSAIHRAVPCQLQSLHGAIKVHGGSTHRIFSADQGLHNCNCLRLPPCIPFRAFDYTKYLNSYDIL